MTELQSHQLANWSKQFRFPKGRVLRVRLQRVAEVDPTVDLYLLVRPAIVQLDQSMKAVRLHLQLRDVSEFRLLKRPTIDRFVIGRFRINFLERRFFLDFDSYLEEDEKAEMFDYRASDLFFACQSMKWKIITPKKSGATES